MLWAGQQLLVRKIYGNKMPEENKKPDLKKILLQKDTQVMVLFKNEKGQEDIIYLKPRKLAQLLE